MIADNKNNDDIYLVNGNRINFTGRLTSPKKIGVNADSGDATVTSYYSTHQTQDPNDIFVSAKEGGVLRMTAVSDGEVMLRTGSKTLLEIYVGTTRTTKKATLWRHMKRSESFCPARSSSSRTRGSFTVLRPRKKALSRSVKPLWTAFRMTELTIADAGGSWSVVGR